MLRLALALVTLPPLARCDDYTYHTGELLQQSACALPNDHLTVYIGGDHHYGSDPVDYTAHNYGDGATPAHGDEVVCATVPTRPCLACLR
jgi:hypothetical protein